MNVPKFPSMLIDDDSDVVIVTNFCVDKSRKELVNIHFRYPTGKDGSAIKSIYADTNSSIDPDYKMLSLFCTQFGDDESLTPGELESDTIPYSHIRFLKSKVMNELFPDLP